MIRRKPTVIYEEIDELDSDTEARKEEEKEAKRRLLFQINEILEDDDMIDKMEPTPLKQLSEKEVMLELADQYQIEYEHQFRGMRQSSVVLVPMNAIQLAEAYHDKYCLLQLRKGINLKVLQFQHYCRVIAVHPLLTVIGLVIIITNSVMMAIQVDSREFELFFIYYYSMEALLKIIGFGFIMKRNSYFRDFWNILDFTIVVTSILALVLTFSLNLNALRVLRVLKSLQAAQSVKALKQILTSLFASIVQLKDAVIVLLFSYSVFAIIGLRLFSGILKKRCIDDNGITISNSVCNECSDGYICAKQLSNPQSELTNFDTFGWAFIQVFIGTTMEGWSTIMNYLVAALNYAAVLYFLAIVLVGGFFLVNLTLAIIKLNFSNSGAAPAVEPEETYYNYHQLRELNIYKPMRPPCKALYGCSDVVEPRKFKTRRNALQKRSIFQQRSTMLMNKTFKQQPKVQFLPMRGVLQMSKPFEVRGKWKFFGIQGVPTPKNKRRGSRQQQQQQQKQQQQDQQILQMTPPQPILYNQPSIDQESVQMQPDVIRSDRLLSMVSVSVNNQLVSPSNSKSNDTNFINEFTVSKSIEKPPEIQQIPQFVRSNIHRYTETANSLVVPLGLKETQQSSFKVKHNKYDELWTRHTELFNSQDDSVMNSVGVDDIDERMYELGFSERPAKVVKPAVKMPSRSQKRGRLIMQRAPASSISEKQQKLKNKLFHIKFHARVHYVQYESTSEKNVLITNKGQSELKLVENSRLKGGRLEYRFKNDSTQFQQGQSVNTDNDLQSWQYGSRTSLRRVKLRKPKQEYNYMKLSRKFRKEYTMMSTDRQREVCLPVDESEDPNADDMKQSRFYIEYNQTIEQQYSNELVAVEASIEDVLIIQQMRYYDEYFIHQMDSILRALNYTKEQINIWLPGWSGRFSTIEQKCSKFILSQHFSRLLNMAVALNTVMLSLDGFVENEELLSEFNVAFTIIFTIEFGLKLFALGFRGYIRDKLNVFDAAIVVISLYEIFFVDSGKSSFTVLRSVRIFRALRVLRISKLIRSLQFMNFLLKVLGNAFEQIIYMFLLLLLFLYTFTLLGLSLFNGSISDDSRFNFNTFLNSFEIVFQVLTLSNWNNVLYLLLLSPNSYVVTILYLVIWIAIGNYVFLNLFLAVLLDNFEVEYRSDRKQIDTKMVIARDQINDTESQGSRSVRSRGTRNSIQLSDQQIYDKTSKQPFIYFIEMGLAEHSLWLFSQDNQIRKICYRLVKDSKFEYLVLCVIILSSLKLIMDTYEMNTTISSISSAVDTLLIALFAMESVMKIVAFGFVLDQHSYLRDSWNRLDMFILIISLVDVGFSSINLSFLKILRLLRTLRPLRFITHASSIKILVSALLQSIDGILNVSIVIILVWMMFAIIGINFNRGKMNYCDLGDGKQTFYTQEQCNILGVWKTHDTNFENIFSAMLTLFCLSTLVSWPDYLLLIKDGDVNGPVQNANAAMFWYFACFILIGSILLINLFIGVILVNFHIAEENSRDQSLTPDQHGWVETLKLIASFKPNLSLYYCPHNTIRSICFKVVTSPLFDPFITVVIIGSVLTTSLYMDDATDEYLSLLDQFNQAFGFILMGEAIVKIMAFSPIGYFKHKGNQFDFIIALEASLDTLISLYDARIGNTLRILSVIRLLRLVKQFKGLKKLIDTAIFSIPAIINAGALYFLVHSIFSVLGVFLFQDIRNGNVIDQYTNFSDFHHSFVLLFRSQTGEDWYKIMFDTMRNDQWYNCFFWVCFIIVQKWVMLNLFILIILDQYDQNYFQEDNPLNQFEGNSLIFIKAWASLSPEGDYIHHTYLIELLLRMKEPLGLDLKSALNREFSEWVQMNPHQDQSIKAALKAKIRCQYRMTAALKIQRMEMKCNSDGLLNYSQVMFRTIKDSLRDKINICRSIQGARKLAKREDDTLKEVMDGASEYNQLVNPITQILYGKLIFQTLRKYSTKVRPTRECEFVNVSESSDNINNDVISRDSSFELQQPELILECNSPECMSMPDTSVYRLELIGEEIHDEYIDDVHQLFDDGDL